MHLVTVLANPVGLGEPWVPGIGAPEKLYTSGGSIKEVPPPPDAPLPSPRMCTCGQGSRLHIPAPGTCASTDPYLRSGTHHCKPPPPTGRDIFQLCICGCICPTDARAFCLRWHLPNLPVHGQIASSVSGCKHPVASTPMILPWLCQCQQLGFRHARSEPYIHAQCNMYLIILPS